MIKFGLIKDFLGGFNLKKFTLTLPIAIVFLSLCILFSAVLISNSIREAFNDPYGWELLNERLIDLIDVMKK